MRAELEALRESEARFRALADAVPVLIASCDAERRFKFVNKPYADRLGRRREEIVGRRLADVLGDEIYRGIRPHVDAVLAGRQVEFDVSVGEAADAKHLRCSYAPERDASGAVVGWFAAVVDITERKNAERVAHEQKENLRTLLDTVPVAVFITDDVNCHRVTGNRAAAELLRLPAGSNLAISLAAGARSEHFRFLDHGLPLAHESLPIRRAARGEIVSGEEVEIAFDDGTALHLLVSARPLLDAAGRPSGAVASALDVTTWKKAELALREADRRKDEFLATLSHELRNPLAPIGTAVGILPAVRSDSDRFAELTAIMERQLARLVRLIDDLLDVSRISRGQLKLRKEPVEIHALIREVVEMRRWPGADGHDLELVLPEEPIRLAADAVRLGQVFTNLLSNASKYTPAGGNIRVSVERRNGFAEISVADNGVGIPAAKLDGIFEMFAQLDPQHERSHGGLGIGLSLARQFTELHGGAIEARSGGVGCGSEFVVRLPASPPSEVPAGTEAPEDARPAEAVSARRILVVDDNVDAATTLAALLDMQGHRVEVVHDGAAAVESAAALRPDVILLDIGLPVMDGYAVCRAIRSTPSGKKIFIAAVTGWGHESDRRKSAAAGFDAHLVKPVDARSLTEVIAAPTPRH